MAFVYWIHLPEHTDMFSQGYIGYTSKTVEHRFKQHVTKATQVNASNNTIHNAIRKYKLNGLVITTLVEGSEEYCFYLEGKLRPDKFIGWNQNIGGLLAPSTKDIPKTREHANNISKALKGKSKTSEHVQNMSKCQLEMHKNISPWENYRANKDAWSKAIDIVDFLQSGDRCSDGKLAKLFNISKRSYIVTIKNNFINGWLPEKDSKYLEWLASYKLKQEAQNGPPTI